MEQNNDLIPVFRREHHSLCDRLEALALDAEPRGGLTAEELQELLRVLHTIKGSSAMMGLLPVAAAAHRAEDLFVLLSRGAVLPSRELFDLLFRLVDFFRREPDTPGCEQSLTGDIDKLLASVKGIAEKKSETICFASTQNLDRPYPYGLRIFFEPDCGMEPLRSLLLIQTLRRKLPDAPFAADSGQTEPEVLAAQGLRLAFGDRASLQKAIPLLEALSFVRCCQPEADPQPPAIPVEAAQLEQLESLTKQFEQACSLSEVRRLTAELSELTLAMGRTDLSLLFQQARRAVREAGRALKKPVRLSCAGASLRVERSLAEALAPPLLHLLRNAVDHGIESPAERLAAGKPTVGTLSLTAEKTGGTLTLRLRDDGRGVDFPAVQRTALAQGLLPPEETPSQQQLLALLLAPGFSTSPTVTEFSGRGVGLDAVRQSVLMLGGSMELESTPGHGTTVTLRLPCENAAP